MVDSCLDVQKGIYDCPVLSVRNPVGNIYLMRLECPAVARSALPGQFINIKVNNEVVPLLRKPFSICRRSKQEGWIEVLWKIVGKGTEIMSQCRTGEKINILAPLGRAFQIPARLETAYLVAGGLGVAPFPFLCEFLLTRGISVEVFLGARSQNELSFVAEFQEMGVALHVSTEDGTQGYRGLVTEMVVRRIKDTQGSLHRHLFSCGPTGFLQSMIGITEIFDIEGQVSLETMMGCGFGICVGCPVRVKGPEAVTTPYKLTCMEGPAFDAREVSLDD